MKARTAMDFPAWMRTCAEQVERRLGALLPQDDEAPAHLHGAMRYAVLGGGKRVRALLVLAAGHACQPAGKPVAIVTALESAAAAVEMIHGYSLVHDDLPCMDNDTLRRGKPTTHVAYGEAAALLAGDALQPLAFETLAGMPIAPALIVQSVQVLARASGSLGMAGGQFIDLDSTGHGLSLDQLRGMHTMKTGALLAASVTLGGVVAGASSPQRQALEKYAAAIGLAFQVVDDILDVTADSASLGKTAGKDAQDNKPTYVSLMGVDAARELAAQLRDDAHQALRPLGEAGAYLAAMADFIVAREY
ncbi:polyprenyl synthetase family protein [Kerstersia gyiorum]|jgi:farnesyl diphosphate synthase|uniref:Farnesyl-diphosphate synthase n=1 Tax=Kerstersia gyiorum TaxID=206506 RepID=A0A171KUU7_9BURK|nr:farnesyl diphosphate synthase [Kerstersia gyiorum]AZV93159.1 geranyl transferase [Bordetella sp. J329]MCO7640883.1 polyprenyl synthetase family protein [Pseudomonas sp. S 311-6]KAB0543531.1 polyprenyl synthetase family protein [Kerstersia gyiorum]KKO72664.1 geranyl transferase [Kerstersia gyiorum]MCH4272778.1 polyprenyl synthetase family protein [Kerstersia gyiorum]